MSFLEKRSDTLFILKVNIKPNSRQQQIINSGEYLTISVRSKAKQNKANIEIIKLLRRKLNIPSNQIKMISGLKSSNKIIQLTFTEKLQYQIIYNKLIN